MCAEQKNYVYRLRYQQPQRERGEPEVGFPGGEIVRDENNRPKYGPTVTRYFMTHKGLKNKVRKVLDPEQGSDYDLEPCPGIVVSVETAPVGEWQKVAP